MSEIRAGIIGIGMATPEKILTNSDLEKLVDTNDEWITSRTGMKERWICGPDETSATLGTQAAKNALAMANLDPAKLDLIICATATPDHPWPATACLIQQSIGAVNAAAFDLSAACSGFCYGLATASGFIQTQACKNVLVIGVDTLTKQVDWTDRNTCILFGDGAGAAVLTATEGPYGVLASTLGADGTGYQQIWLEAGANKSPVTLNLIDEKRHCIKMHGSEVYKFAVKIMGESCLETLAKAGLTSADVDLFIPHQANIRIINSAADRMSLPPEKVFVNVHKYGNTSAASIPIAMTEALAEGRIKKGDVIVCVGFGAGLTWASNVIRWGVA